MSDVTVRPATITDVPLVLTLIRELAAFEKLSHEVVATEEKLRATLFGKAAAAEVLVAELGGEGVGFALFFPSYSTFLAQPGIYLEDLFVRPAHRSHGIGLTLLRALARIALERGCGRLEWSVLDWNERALAFYRRLGAKPQSEWTVQRLTEPGIRALAEG
jgi:GNAT superfamily N-acetyltransferase